jgi:uncharacterized protein YggT (Ycf19 family)
MKKVILILIAGLLYSKKFAMKKILVLILTFFISTVANADVKGQALSKASEKISYTIGNLIPGEGVSEVSVEIREEDNPDTYKIKKLLKKYPYEAFYYSLDLKKFTSKKINML